MAWGRCRLEWEADLSAVRTLIGALLLSVAFSATALAQERASPGARLDEDALQLSSPLAQDTDRHLGAARGIEHELSLEQSRVNARSTSDIQQRQTTRDVQLSGQRLDALVGGAPGALDSSAGAPARPGQPADRCNQPRSRPRVRLLDQPRPERLDRSRLVHPV